MQQHLKDLREFLLDKNKTLSLADLIVDGIIERMNLTEEEMDEEKAKRENRATPRFVIDMIVKGNFEKIHRYAVSPIERIFLSALYVSLASYGPFSVMFTPPIKADTFPDHLRENYKASIYMWEQFQEEAGSDVLEEFLDVVRQIPEVDEDALMELRINIMMYLQFGMYNNFHFSMQPTFTKIKVNKRGIKPDLFIWIPANPDFKLVVECDGFNYHSTKEAFSRDRARDRLLQSNGYKVFRFSGQEIYNDPIGKSMELYEYLMKNYEDQDENAHDNHELQPNG